MARKKAKKLSKVTATRESPIQPGTAEVFGPGAGGRGLFGPTVVRIRSDAEIAATSQRAGPELEKMLGEIFKEPGLPPHGTGNLAETVWPGFNAMMQLLIDRESEFVVALGALGMGVA